MRPAGRDTLALWREAGEWWANEPYREIHRFVDDKGVRRAEETLLPSIGTLGGSTQKPYIEDNTIEVTERARKIRDEKVSAACGVLPAAYYADRAKERDFREGGDRYALGMKVKMPAREARRDDWGMPTGYSGIQAVRTQKKHDTYVPLHVCSGYAFGRGTMLAEELPLVAASFGIGACAIADPMSLVGCVEFSKACKKYGLKPLIGASFELPEGGEIVLIARSKRGYVSLSQLITECHLGEPRCFPLCNWERLARHSRDLICLTGGDVGPINRVLIRRDTKAAETLLKRLIAVYGRENVCIEIERSYLPWEITVNRQLLELTERESLTPFAGGLITHARPEDFAVQDLLTCVETLCTVEEIVGRKPARHEDQPQIARLPERAINAERYMHTPDEMRALFADRPDLLASTRVIAERVDDEVLPDRTQLPEIFPDDNQALRELTQIGMYQHYEKTPSKLKSRIEMELNRIIELGFARHFLAANDMVRWADEHQIHYSGRGSVVDSAVAYCLGLSRIDAYKHNLHFDRFMPVDGSKRPDIDVDFESRRRDDVREYLTRKYGRDNVATVSAIGAYCTRGIVREVGKALGLPPETIGFLAKRIHGGVPAHQLESALENRPELRGSGIPRERFKWVFQLAEKLMDIPRNIRSHSSGIVISSQPLSETVPMMWSGASARLTEGSGVLGYSGIEEATDTSTPQHSNTPPPQIRIVQWDKRSCKHFFDKFDVLCLRGQDVLAGTEERIRVNTKDFSSTRLPIDDPETYRAMRSGELIGIPQSASPAMRQAHIRLKTKNLHDASLVQAGIRPGVGGAVKLNELIARRLGKKQYSFEHPQLEEILGHTYGIIVFQEQVDQLLQTFCGFSSGQAEDLRDSIYKRRREDFTQQIQIELEETIVGRGYTRPVAKQVVEYIVGFKGYGFAEGHALAFAEISIRSIYCQQNHPSEYFAALLSAQPAGYYGPCTIVNEARGRGVDILPPDVNSSEEEFAAQDIVSGNLAIPNGAIRVALKQVALLSDSTRKRLIAHPRIAVERHPEREVTRHSAIHNPQSNIRLDSAPHGYAVAQDEGQSPIHNPQSKICNQSTIRFTSIFDFAAKVKPERDELEQLILCGAFDSLHSKRRALLWAIPAALDYAKQLDPGALPIQMPEPEIPEEIDDFSEIEKAIHERRVLGLDVAMHLMAFERERVKSRGVITSEEAKSLPAGRKAIVVGNPIRLRFPPTASGKRVVFFDLEDETGLLNVTCFDDVYQKDGHAIVCSAYVTIIGEAQDRDGHTAFLAKRVFAYEPVIARQGNEERLPVVSGDFLVG